MANRGTVCIHLAFSRRGPQNCRNAIRIPGQLQGGHRDEASAFAGRLARVSVAGRYRQRRCANCHPRNRARFAWPLDATFGLRQNGAGATGTSFFFPPPPPPCQPRPPTPNRTATSRSKRRYLDWRWRTVTCNNTPTPLKPKDDIFLNDVVQTAANSTLGITFNDATTFNLNTANASITIDNYVYQDGGKQNSALLDIAKGTVAYRCGRGRQYRRHEVIDADRDHGYSRHHRPARGAGRHIPPTNARAMSGIKLYPDADGRVGHIEVNGRDGARPGTLTQGLQRLLHLAAGRAGARVAARPLAISPQQALRDQGIVRQVHAAQSVGRQIVTRQRALRQANPNRNNLRNNPSRQPGLQRQNNLPQRQNGLPQRPGSPLAPGQPNRQENRQEQNRQGQIQPPPGTPRSANGPGIRQPGPPPGLQRPGFPNRPALQRRAPPPKGKPGKEKR